MGCGCGENIVLPAGPQGPAGADGADGSNGTNGTDGTTILYNSVSDSGTSAAASPQTLKSYTLPANTLGVNGDAIEIECWVDLPSTSNDTYSVNLKLGGVTLVTQQATISSDGRSWSFKALVSRIGSSSERMVGERLLQYYQTSWVAAPISMVDKMRFDVAVDLTSDQDIEVVVTKGSSFTLNEMICRQLIVTHLKQ